MKTIVKYLFLILFVFAGFSLTAQTIEYDYDDAGNRVERKQEIKLKNSTIEETDPITTIYDETNQKLAKGFVPEKLYKDNRGEQKITIYTNPTRGQMVVQINNIREGITGEVIVYDLSGKIVLTQQNISEYSNVDISKIQSGTYIMKIIVGDTISDWKVIKGIIK